MQIGGRIESYQGGFGGSVRAGVIGTATIITAIAMTIANTPTTVVGVGWGRSER